jgi:hypothetical protein
LGSVAVERDHDPERPRDVEVMIGSFKKTLFEVQTKLAHFPARPMLIPTLVELGNRNLRQPQAVVSDPDDPSLIYIDPTLAAALDRLGHLRRAGGVDGDALAEKVADRIAARLGSVQGHLSLRDEPAKPKTLPDPDAVLTTVQVAQLLELPLKTVRTMAAGGTKTPFSRGGCKKTGRQWRVMGWAVKLPMFKVTRNNRDAVKCWTKKEAASILATAKEHASWFYALFLFLFETGARKSEPIALTWKRIDFDQKIVKIWNDETTQYEVKSKEREVPISDHLLVVLKEQKLKWGKSEYVFPCVSSRFEGTRGEKMAEFPDNSWRRIVTLVGLSGGPHKARHTYASLFLREKPDLFLLGRLLGHSHSRVTELYSHLLPEHLAEARNVVSFAPVPPFPAQNPISTQSRRRKLKTPKDA